MNPSRKKALVGGERKVEFKRRARGRAGGGEGPRRRLRLDEFL
jgi:hypothetical protein